MIMVDGSIPSSIDADIGRGGHLVNLYHLASRLQF